MPYKAGLTQAIRDEEAKLFQRQAILIAAPGAVLLAFMGLAGWLAVHVIKTPELFGGGIYDQIGYGVLGVIVLLWLTKGYIFDKWMSAWLELDSVCRVNVTKIEAVMAKLDKEAQEKAAQATTGGAPKQSDDPWKRALVSEVPQDLGADSPRL